MKKFIYIALSALTIHSAFAHHVVDQVTTNNKLIISKDYDQKIVDGKVLTYKLNSKRPEFSREVIGEHALPKVGDKVKIFRTTIKLSNSRGKRIETLDRQQVGTATIVSPELAGDSREVALNVNRKNARMEFKNMPYSEDEIKSIKANSLVAVPDGNFKVEHYDSVEF